MSTRMLLLMLPILLACSRSTTTDSYGAAPAGAENDAAGRQAVSQLEDEWARAIETHDTAFLARVVAPEDQDRQVRVYGNGMVAVVTALGSWTVEKGERPGQYSGRYTETWVKRDGQWQAVAGHYSDVPQVPSQP
jgi:hypothetical protein